jgi:hypothetical protein
MTKFRINISLHFFVWIVCMSCLVFACDTKRNIEPAYKSFFVKYFGGDGDQTAVDFVLDEQDNSIIILGNSVTDQLTGNKLYLVKVDADGNLLWESQFGTKNDIAKDIEFTIEGDLVVLANHNISDDDSDLKLLRVSLVNGEPMDSVTYGSPKVDVAQSVTPIQDGGFIVTGWTSFDETGVSDPNNPDESDIFHFRCNSSLVFDDVFWIGQFGAGTVDQGSKVFEYEPGVYYVFGNTDQVHQGNSAGKLNLFYYSLDNGGVNGSSDFLGDFDNDTEAKFVMEVPAVLGGGYLLASTEHLPTGGVTIHATKLRTPLTFNADNDEQFDRQVAIGARELVMQSASATVIGKQGYLMLANEQRETGDNIWLTKIDLSGNEIWSVSYGSEEDDDNGAAVLELPNGRILVLGSVRLINNQYKIVLMKLNSLGQLKE